MTIKIVVDSTSYIPKDILDKLDISVISLNVISGGISKREIDINLEEFYDELSRCKELPTSSQPSIRETKSAFENIIKNGDEVLGIFISSDMSGTFSTANLVKNMILEENSNAKINIIDSRTNSMQAGLIAIECAKAAKNGLNMNEVLKVGNRAIKESKFLFLPENLKYLKKGGRIGGAQALFGNILKIIPILTIIDGNTEVFCKVRTKKKAIDTIINSVLEEAKINGIKDIVIHHIDCTKEGIKIKGLLESGLKENNINLDSEIKIVSIGPVVGLHVGPGSIGIAYLK